MVDDIEVQAAEDQPNVTEVAESAPRVDGAGGKPVGRSAESEPDAGAKDEAAASQDDAAASRRRGRPGAIPVGIAHIRATFNNTVVSITDTRGGVISWGSAGRSGFKGSRKSTAFAATTVAQDAARQAVARGMHEIEVRVEGAGAGRESAIRGLQSSGLNIVMIKDVTSIPHNGCRARKRRRV